MTLIEGAHAYTILRDAIIRIIAYFTTCKSILTLGFQFSNGFLVIETVRNGFLVIETVRKSITCLQ